MAALDLTGLGLGHGGRDDISGRRNEDDAPTERRVVVFWVNPSFLTLGEIVREQGPLNLLSTGCFDPFNINDLKVDLGAFCSLFIGFYRGRLLSNSRPDLRCSKTSGFVHQHLVPSVGIDMKSCVGFLSFFHLHRESAKPNRLATASTIPLHKIFSSIKRSQDQRPI
ncbi:hypothetical protein DVH24_041096 [Malus domestica]|uniref:Uncharacterized protein n=1 Tax=Malus domestica TaxID=3750 RepID=A0A498IAI9_MALDO|nr:hypothetical protein DVH24_041096 [Malus domestica]